MWLECPGQEGGHLEIWLEGVWGFGFYFKYENNGGVEIEEGWDLAYI